MKSNEINEFILTSKKPQNSVFKRVLGLFTSSMGILENCI